MLDNSKDVLIVRGLAFFAHSAIVYAEQQHTIDLLPIPSSMMIFTA